MKPRLYRDDGTTNPDINLSHMKLQAHALFCQWVRSNYHVRDFVEAIEHQATSLYSEYLISGSPEIPAHLLLPDAATLISMAPFFEAQLTDNEHKPRFYTAGGALNPTILLGEEFQAVLAQLFGHWVNRGYHARDFIQAVKDCAMTVYHGYTTSESMDGLGGCKTTEQFLNTRPAQ
jgi:hypothetical protein